MRYIQTDLNEEDFIVVKKAALDAKISLKDYVKEAIFDKLFLDAVETKKPNFKKEVKAQDTDEIGSSD